MALTPFRWIAAALASCLMLAVVILRDEPSARRPADMDRVLTTRSDLYGSHAARAASRLHLWMLLDSVGVRTDPAPGVPPIRVRIDASIPVAAHAALDSLASRAVRPVRDSGHVGIDIVFVYDTLSEIHGAPLYRAYGTYVNYVLPSQEGGRCAAIAHLGKESTNPRQIAGVLESEVAAQQFLGPCAFYRAFGVPGHEVDSWLRERGWAFAREATWQQRAQPVNLTAELFGMAPSPIETLLSVGTSLPLLVEMSAPAVGCAAGYLAECGRTSRGWQPRARPAMWRGNILVRNYPNLSLESNYYMSHFGFGRRESSLLADMVRTLGPERFRRFWTSSEQVPIAFEKASGESLDRWTSRWVVEQYGPVPPRGPGLTTWSVAMSLGLVALAMLVTLRVSARRQFV